MGFDEGRIVLDSANGAYYPGQTLFGRLEFDQDKLKTFRGLYVKIKGFCKVEWSTDHTRRDGDRTVSYTVAHESYEEYIDAKIFLAGGKDGEHHLQPGHHVFPFQWRIPDTCPSTFEGEYGHIRYQIKVVVDRPFKFDQEKLATFRIVAPLDLNSIPNCKEPIQFEITNTFCCWCMNSGGAQTLIKIPVGGFCPGQVIPIELSCVNSSTVEIDFVKFALKKKVIYHAANEPDTREENFVLAEQKQGSVPGHTTRNWLVNMDVPGMDVINLNGCRYIDIEYILKVTVEAEGCHDDSEEYHLIMIGSIPLVGFQDNVANPMHDQAPQIVQNFQTTSSYPQAITTQPLPAVSPYPGGNSPYPNVNAPYPGASPTVTPYPGANSPYPGASSPYPGANPPYPGASSPYPGANPPYPAASSPYPGANSPYPGANPPYPGANPLHPTTIVVTAPSPSTGSYNSNAPYPGGASSPYPAGPTTPRTTTTPLKTGTLGFTVPNADRGNEATMPLLPPGAVSYSPRQASPYASATAPEPATPDSENKKPMDTSAATSPMPVNPPYNPNFQ